jgi:divalent metal cation (Fe/Co/Zn/Cd) transporter
VITESKTAIYAVRLRSALSTAEVKQTVDRVEKAIRQQHPDVKHIFTEFDSEAAKPL